MGEGLEGEGLELLGILDLPRVVQYLIHMQWQSPITRIEHIT